MPPGKDGICLEPDGAFEGVFLEVVEDTGKPYILPGNVGMVLFL
jgi:hypothetical protein